MTLLRRLALLVLLMLPGFFFLLRPGVYWNMHDDMQLIRQLDMEKCLKDGQIPCRWTPDLGYGYGYPLFNFYPPLPYYIGQVFRTIGFSFVATVKATAILQFVIAGIGMYLLAALFTGTLGAYLAALFYTYAPYHAVNIYVRGAMNEAWAGAVFPYIFYFTYKAITRQKLSDYLLSSVSFALLLLSHNPMALIFSPFLALWILYWIFTTKPIRSFPDYLLSHLKIGTALLFSLGLSAYFTFPVLFESQLVQIESMFANYYHYSLHFVSLKQLFVSNYWGDGPSLWGPNDGMSFSIGYLHWVIPLLVVCFVFWRYFFQKKRLETLPFLLFTFALTSLFLTHERSTFAWQIITPFQKIQFPWRFLSLGIFFTSFLSGLVTNYLPFKKNYHLPFTLVVGIVLFAINILHFTPVTFGPITDSEKFSGKAWVNQVTGGIYDYLPKTSPTAPKSPAADFVDQVIPATAEFQLSGQKKGTDWLFFNINTALNTEIVLPVLYFPDFKLTVDNQSVEIYPDKELGRITFSLAPGNHQVYLKLHNTPIRTVSNTISFVSLIVLGILLTFPAPFSPWKATKLKR